MKNFAILLEKLILTPSRNRKIEALADYFSHTPDSDRGYALAAITRDLSFANLKSSHLKNMTMEKVDPVLFGISYDYVGDLGETIALIWPVHEKGELPSVSEFIDMANHTPKTQLAAKVAAILDMADPNERWAIIKLITGNLRIGVSARTAKMALAQYSGQPLEEIEKIWHGLEIPYSNLFEWLDGKAEKPVIHHARTFHPMMLATPVDAEKDFEKLNPADYNAEWKWDGIRVQLVFDAEHKRMYSRTGDDISGAFPDVTEILHGAGVLDGELLVGSEFNPLPFNDLQQRLNRKTVIKKHLADYPAFIRVYDMLFDGLEDIRHLPLSQRRERLERWHAAHPNPRLDLSELLPFKSWDDLGTLRQQGADEHGHEGLMIKRKDSAYVSGRPKGPWFKWKRDALLVDAVLMYAQRGHGKRSSFYSDFTFGVWQGNDIVPIGKAYSGFTDEELKRLDKWVRANTIAKFGPVREVKKELVVEVAFDSAHESKRHKSGIALRFPRIHRIRWDKPVQEVEGIDAVREQLGLNNHIKKI